MRMAYFVVVLVVAVLPLRADHRKDAAEKDKRLLQGEWVATRADFPNGEGAPGKIRIHGPRLIYLDRPDGQFVFDLDPTESPREINLYQGKKLLYRGIYEISEKEVKIALSVIVMRPSMKGTWIEAGDRPREFQPENTLILRRQPGR